MRMLVLFSLLTAASGCAKAPEGNAIPPYLCMTDDDCYKPGDEIPPGFGSDFLNVENATCREIEPGYRRCSECSSDEECPGNARCGNGLYCYYPGGNPDVSDTGEDSGSDIGAALTDAAAGADSGVDSGFSDAGQDGDAANHGAD